MISYKREDSEGHYASSTLKLDYTSNNPDRDKLISKTVKVIVTVIISLILLSIIRIIVGLILGPHLDDCLNNITMGVIFISIGFLVIYKSIIEANKRKKRCTLKIQAEVYDVRISSSTDNNGHRRYSYFPVYKFDYNGSTYKVESTSGSGTYNKDLGIMEDILINPSNPIEIYMFDEDNHEIALIISGICILIGLFLFIPGIIGFVK